MKNWAADTSICLLLVAILISGSNILFGGPEPLPIDEKDYSKEVPVQKSWCETPSLWEIRIGAPAWLDADWVALHEVRLQKERLHRRERVERTVLANRNQFLGVMRREEGK